MPVTSKKGGGGQPKSPYTTARLYADDADNMTELSDKRGMNVAQLFRSLGFSEVVRKELMDENRKRLKDLESQRPE
jgi:hypothetical protein